MAAYPPLLPQDLTRPDGTVALDVLVSTLRVTKAELTLVLGLPRDSLTKTRRLGSPASQRRLRDLVEILARAAPWAGSIPQAFAWFTSQPLPSFGDRTAAELMREGRPEAVTSYLSRIAAGGYA
ncbi:antitoxin Xre/MbcA/ParS toxin-binding domain-containing protein [Tranquillimonas alkanivorans]|uniref:Antitoxin Xre/MbcA/ParS-like toxin-binding domain-containing protein n=1 Tax=Tranquillimonas alkanivorans TaxID=441119 RepID=A0A1I5WBL6_9RHOB|nr:antitoxin Xre/MbcA/ParS toxin-binding domain-containing protein [Tranquillimonas alkanivorans]SFQ17143.1 Protein of unknown function [Tranquillimonas alkanivorans]